MLFLACMAASALALHGQSPAFDAATVKPAGPVDPARPSFMPDNMSFQGGPGTKSPGRINYYRVSLRATLARAYNMSPHQISGPEWMDTERYDIVATFPPATTEEQLRTMLQGLLTERFAIAMHRETRVMPVYHLVVAKNGPKLAQPETLPEYKDDAEREAATRARAQANLRELVARVNAGDRSAGRSFHLPRATLDKFADTLTSHVDRPVRGKTELKGFYAFTLSWSPEGPLPAGADPSFAGPSIFAAVQEQLGLKLQPEKEESELIVVDKAEKLPAGN